MGFAVRVTTELHAGARVRLPPLSHPGAVGAAGELWGPAEHPWAPRSDASLARVTALGCRVLTPITRSNLQPLDGGAEGTPEA